MAIFGARGAVWAYNRFADAVMHIARVYPTIMAAHYVDDTGAVEAGPIAQSGFEAYERERNTAHTPEKVETATPHCRT